MTGRLDKELTVLYKNSDMPSLRPTTTVRFTDEDREILDKLQRLTGLDSATAVLRMAIREALASREKHARKK